MATQESKFEASDFLFINTLFELKAKIRAVSLSLCGRVLKNFGGRLEECRSRDNSHLSDISFKTQFPVYWL